MKKNNFSLMQDLTSIIQMSLLVLTKGGPCILEFSEGGGISGNILTNIPRHLDAFKFYDNDRGNVIPPAILVDGHGSCFGLGF